MKKNIEYKNATNLCNKLLTISLNDYSYIKNEKRKKRWIKNMILVIFS